ncbi:DUF4339 domain-containing protein [Planctomycetota bacterium]
MGTDMWYIGIGGEQRGPLPEDEIKAMILRRELTARNYVWKEGMDSWLPVAEVDDFADTLAEAPPPPSKPLPGARSIGGFFRDLAAVVRDPDAGLAAVLDKKPVCFAVTWMALGTLVFALMTQHSGTVPMVFEGMGSGWAAFGRGILNALVRYGVWCGALMIAFGPILKSEADWKDSLAVLGVSAIPTTVLGLLLFSLLWIPSPVVNRLTLLAVLLTAVPAKVLLLYLTFRHVTRCSRRAAFFSIVLICVGANFAYALIRLAMS